MVWRWVFVVPQTCLSCCRKYNIDPFPKKDNSRKSSEIRQYGALQPGKKQLRSESLSSKYCLFSRSDYQAHDAGWWQGRRRKEEDAVQSCSAVCLCLVQVAEVEGCQATVHVAIMFYWETPSKGSSTEDCEMIKILPRWLMCLSSVSLFELHDCWAQEAASWWSPLRWLWIALLLDTGGGEKARRDGWLESTAGRGTRRQLRSWVKLWVKLSRQRIRLQSWKKSSRSLAWLRASLFLFSLLRKPWWNWKHEWNVKTCEQNLILSAPIQPVFPVWNQNERVNGY